MELKVALLGQHLLLALVLHPWLKIWVHDPDIVNQTSEQVLAMGTGTGVQMWWNSGEVR